MNCEECNNEGYFLKPDYQHDVMMRVQCITCLHHEQMKFDLSLKVAKVLINTNQVRMAKLLADTLIGLQYSKHHHVYVYVMEYKGTI